MLLGYRSNDAVITICQNNNAKSIEIMDINPAAEEILGYKNAALAKTPLWKILPPRIGTLLEEYVEFSSNSNDVGEVLSKVQSFAIVSRDERETGYRLKVVRDTSESGFITFRLVLQDRLGLRKNEALRKAVQENFKGHEVLDAETGLPDRASLVKDIELIGYYNSKTDLRTCFAVLQLDHYDALDAKHGRKTCVDIIRHIAAICRQNLRPDDVIGSLSYNRLGIVLIDTMPESARMVSNRLRWQVAANPYMLPQRVSLGVSVSVAFKKISGTAGDKTIIDACCAALDGIGKNAANALIEVDEDDKIVS